MRHVKSSKYLDRFHLEIRHKVEKPNVVHDALSRLKTNKPDKNLKSKVLLQYPVVIVNINHGFLDRLKNAYQSDLKCFRILQILNNNQNLAKNSTSLPFESTNIVLYARPGSIYSVPRPVPKFFTARYFQVGA